MNQKLASALVLVGLLVVPAAPAQEPGTVKQCIDGVQIDLIDDSRSAADPNCIPDCSVNINPATVCGAPVCDGATGKTEDGPRVCGRPESTSYLPTTPGQPKPVEATDFAVLFNEVFLLVDPAGRLSVAPGVVLPMEFTVVVRFMDAPDVDYVTTYGAVLRIMGPTGQTLQSYLAWPEDAGSGTDFVVEFPGIPPLESASYILAYAGRELHFNPVFAERSVDTEPCNYHAVPGYCAPLPSTDPCTHRYVPGLCGPVTVCSWPLTLLPPCQPVLGCEGGGDVSQCVPYCLGLEICDIEPPCQGDADCTEPCTSVPALCDDKPCEGALLDCLAALCQENPGLCDIEEPCPEGVENCVDDPCTSLPSICGRLCDGPVVECLASLCQENPELCDISLPCEGDVLGCVESPCESDPALCDISVPPVLEPCDVSSLVCLLDACTGSINECVNPCATAGPICDIGLCEDGSCDDLLAPQRAQSQPQSNQDCAGLAYGKNSDWSESYLETQETSTIAADFAMGHHYSFVHFYDACERYVWPTDVGLGYIWHGPSLQAADTDFDVSWHLVTTATDNQVILKPFVYYGPVSGGILQINEARPVGQRASCSSTATWPTDLLRAISLVANEQQWLRTVSQAASLIPMNRDYYCALQDKQWDPISLHPDPYTGTGDGKGIQFTYRRGSDRGEFGGEIDLYAIGSGRYTMDLTSASVAYASWYAPSGDSVNARIYLGEEHMKPTGCIANGEGVCPTPVDE